MKVLPIFSAELSDTEENEERGDARPRKALKRKRVRMQTSDDSDEDALQIHMEETIEDSENHEGPSNMSDEEEVVARLADENVKSKQPVGLENQSESSDSNQNDNDGRKRGRPKEFAEESESSDDDDDFDVPLIRTKRAKTAVLDDDDDDD